MCLKVYIEESLMCLHELNNNNWVMLMPNLKNLALTKFKKFGWYCGAGVFGLIGCKSLSPSPALPASFNNNDNKNNFLILVFKVCGYYLLPNLVCVW